MGNGYSKWDVETIRHSVKRVTIDGLPLRKAARESGVPVSTLGGWVQRFSGFVDDDGVAPNAPTKDWTEELAPGERPGNAVEAALRLPPGATPDDWATIGRRYPPGRHMTSAQSAAIFHAVAMGAPMAIAAGRAGFSDGDVEIWRSRAKDGAPWEDWYTALKMCFNALIVELGRKCVAGFAGWQGAARQLIALRPDIFNVKESRGDIGGSSIEGLDQASLLALVDKQVDRLKGGDNQRAQRPPCVIVPLHDTGMDDVADG